MLNVARYFDNIFLGCHLLLNIRQIAGKRFDARLYFT